MELRLNREEITAPEVIFSETQEQAVELDYVLPDYYPEIFKIIKCMAKPQIVSYSISGNKLTYEMAVAIKVLYCSDNTKCTQVIDQKLTYTKSADLGKTPENPRISIEPKTDYINCRAVNGRRIDVRGAVSAKICVWDLIKNEAVSDAFGSNIQLKKTPLTYPAHRLYTAKRVSVADNFALGTAKPPITSILRSDAVAVTNDKKVIANKLVAKGEAFINLLYTCIKDGIDSIDSVQFNMPFSQIIDLEGVDERYEVAAPAEIVSCDVSPTTDETGNATGAEISLGMIIPVTAYRVATVDVVTDEYSTAFDTESTKNDIKIEMIPQDINAAASVKTTAEYNEGELECIYDVWATSANTVSRVNPETSTVDISGNLIFTAIAKNTDGFTAVIEKDEPYEISIPVENISEYSTADLKVVPISCSFNLSSGNSIDAKAELKIIGTVQNAQKVSVVTDISVDEESPRLRDKDYAVKLYYPDSYEELWDIAKKYGTSVEAIAEENDLEDGCAACKMLLIPIV
ncbi:MAG: DUF3794 domain-containing protein [Ruminococcus sp.]|jgi:hypothetical protein|nr:DUF3794 domain-containing protein [Ruminococcus sp.]